MKKIVQFVAPLLVIAAGAGGFAFLHWSKPEPEKKTETARALSVFVERVDEVDIALEVTTEGEVRPGTQVNIVSQVPGRVVRISPEYIEGGRVIPGAALVEIESIDFSLALTQAEARLAEAELAVQTAIATADVARKQLTNPSTASDLALKKPQVAEAEARREAARAELKQARLNLERTRISLPFEGRIISTSVDVGQYVSPGMTLGKAFATDEVEVRLPLADHQLASLGLPIGFIAEPGEAPQVEFTAQVAGRQQSWQGELVRLDATIDRETRQVFGIARLEDPYTTNTSQYGMPMAVGLYVKARIHGRQVAGARVIPREALRAGDQVYVISDADTLEIRDVGLLHTSETDAVVTSGLEVGERVVLSSIRNAIPGMQIKALDSAVVAESRADGKATHKAIGG